MTTATTEEKVDVLLEKVAMLEAEMDGLRWRVATLEGRATRIEAEPCDCRKQPVSAA